MSDEIILKDLSFYGYHGVFKEENALGQRFRVDMRVGLDLAPAGLHDDVERTISYSDLFEIIHDIVTGERRKLIETLAEDIAQTVLADYEQVEWVKVRIRKPEAPVPATSGEFAVEILRER